MSKDLLIAELLSLPPADQREILGLLQEHFAEDSVLTPDQETELDRRLDRLEREGSRGESWENVYKELSKASVNAHPDR